MGKNNASPLIEICARSDTGLRRKRNEDEFIVIDKPKKGLDIVKLGRMFAVADGMGGHPAGDMASKLACEGLKKSYYGMGHIKKGICNLSNRALMEHLKDSIEAAQKNICNFESGHRECTGFGTTLTVMVLKRDRAFIGHIGDSRLYRLRDGKLARLTTDDTFVQDMIEMGKLTPQEAEQSPYRHVLTQALGGGYEKIHSFQVKINPWDRFLLCTDGLYDMVPEVEIKDILSSPDKLDQVCDRLIGAALEHGGRDNITVIVLVIGDDR